MDLRLSKAIDAAVAVQEYEVGDVVVPASSFGSMQLGDSTCVELFNNGFDEVVNQTVSGCLVHADPEAILINFETTEEI